MGRRTGPQRVRRGAVRDAILVVLAERAMHGYELMTELEARSSGRWRPSPGSIYPALTRMERDGLLSAEEHDGKKAFSLTDRGREARDAVDLDDSDPLPARPREPDDVYEALRALPPEIAGQARQLRRFGSPHQVERAATLLDEVKRRLYDLLADGSRRDADTDGKEGDTG